MPGPTIFIGSIRMYEGGFAKLLQSFATHSNMVYPGALYTVLLPLG